jgi:hypothetical protein
LRQRHSRVPEYTASGDLILPKNFHEWIYVGSPLTPHALNDGKARFPYPAGFKIPDSKLKIPDGKIMRGGQVRSAEGSVASKPAYRFSGRYPLT